MLRWLRRGKGYGDCPQVEFRAGEAFQKSNHIPEWTAWASLETTCLSPVRSGTGCSRSKFITSSLLLVPLLLIRLLLLPLPLPLPLRLRLRLRRRLLLLLLLLLQLVLLLPTTATFAGTLRLRLESIRALQPHNVEALIIRIGVPLKGSLKGFVIGIYKKVL